MGLRELVCWAAGDGLKRALWGIIREPVPTYEGSRLVVRLGKIEGAHES
jgi:hypothetical protein